MLFRMDTLEGIEKGLVTLAFRRWKRPAAKAGGEQRTAIGVIRFVTVEQVEPELIGEHEARAAGYPNCELLFAELEGRDGELYRIELSRIGDDPRLTLREQVEVEPDVLAWLRRIGWAHPILTAIGDRPGVRAGDLAEATGMERDRFKAKVRELKNRGLTISLETGYRLSPRGEAALAMLDRAP